MSEGHFLRGKTITEATDTSLRWLLNHPTPDAVLNIESHAFNVTIHADTCEYSLDVGKNLWLNAARWSRLIKEYVPADGLARFIEQAKEIRSGDARDGATANMMFRDPDRYEKKHRWGGCLMGATFRGDNKRAGRSTITFFSRTSYIGYMGFLDAAIAHAMARQIVGDEHLSEVSFRWHLSSMQLHCFKTLPYLFSVPEYMKQLKVDAVALKVGKRRPGISPTRVNMAKWYNKVLEAWDTHGDQMLEHEKYGPFKRIKRRWMEHSGHSQKRPPPSLPVSRLDFSKAI